MSFLYNDTKRNSSSTTIPDITLRHMSSSDSLFSFLKKDITQNGYKIDYLGNSNTNINSDTSCESINSNQVIKFTMLLLGAKNYEPVSSPYLDIEMYMLKDVFQKLANELDYVDHTPYTDTITETLVDLINMKLVRNDDNSFKLTQQGRECYEQAKTNSTTEEISAVEDFKDLFNDMTIDELWAITYFSNPELDIDINIRNKIMKNRKDLAYSMYKKGKLSISKTAYMSGKYLEDVMNELA